MITGEPRKRASGQEFLLDLERIYDLRFGQSQHYRTEVWKILTRDFFQPLIPSAARVLDVGCGWGEFINHIRADAKYGMDL